VYLAGFLFGWPGKFDVTYWDCILVTQNPGEIEAINLSLIFGAWIIHHTPCITFKTCSCTVTSCIFLSAFHVHWFADSSRTFIFHAHQFAVYHASLIFASFLWFGVTSGLWLLSAYVLGLSFGARCYFGRFAFQPLGDDEISLFFVSRFPLHPLSLYFSFYYI